MSDTKKYFVARGPFRVPTPGIPEGETIELDSDVAAQFVREGTLNPVGFKVDGSGNPVPDADVETASTDASSDATAASTEASSSTESTKVASTDATAAASKADAGDASTDASSDATSDGAPANAGE